MPAFNVRTRRVDSLFAGVTSKLLLDFAFLVKTPIFVNRESKGVVYRRKVTQSRQQLRSET